MKHQKLLLRRNSNNEVWIDTWQDDQLNQDTPYLVKYPRGARTPIDCDILRAEYHFYHELSALLEMPGIGFNYLDKRIAGWQL